MRDARTRYFGDEDARLILEATSAPVIELQPPTAFEKLLEEGGVADPESAEPTSDAIRLLRGSEMTWLNQAAVRMLGAKTAEEAKRSFARWTSARSVESTGITRLMVDSLQQKRATGDFELVSDSGRHAVQMTLISYRDATSHVRFVITLHDVTDEVAVAEDLAKRQAELEVALARSLEDLEVSESRLAATTELILSLVALRDDYTSRHMRDAAALSVEIAERLGCPATLCATLESAALVHDVGKLAIPADLLSKSGRLSSAEMMLMKEHARIGGQLLAKAGFDSSIVEIAAQHHERWDGSGYPNGLREEEASLGARILAVADTIVSMGYHRPYRAALPPDVVYAEIESGKGVRYDGAVAQVALAILQERASA